MEHGGKFKATLTIEDVGTDEVLITTSTSSEGSSSLCHNCKQNLNTHPNISAQLKFHEDMVALGKHHVECLQNRVLHLENEIASLRQANETLRNELKNTVQNAMASRKAVKTYRGDTFNTYTVVVAAVIAMVGTVEPAAKAEAGPRLETTTAGVDAGADEVNFEVEDVYSTLSDTLSPNDEGDDDEESASSLPVVTEEEEGFVFEVAEVAVAGILNINRLTFEFNAPIMGIVTDTDAVADSDAGLEAELDDSEDTLCMGSVGGSEGTLLSMELEDGREVVHWCCGDSKDETGVNAAVGVDVAADVGTGASAGAGVILWGRVLGTSIPIPISPPRILHTDPPTALTALISPISGDARGGGGGVGGAANQDRLLLSLCCLPFTLGGEEGDEVAGAKCDCFQRVHSDEEDLQFTGDDVDCHEGVGQELLEMPFARPALSGRKRRTVTFLAEIEENAQAVLVRDARIT
ncbi:hypothetical protein CPB84DRAFT_1749720 [Gymnopilus junonius]|uniref:Uncharacterized protein n=1 Tax=Gymnopilus junonius TaxID=109634 RepID=A0A9P5NIP5_GYMJU|nr:hypothetical protein CPB84DRAFT_1749720 [Gymnopilus junonius]